MNNFSFSNLGDLVGPKDLIEAGFLNGSKSAIYALFNRQGFPKISIGKKYYITRDNLVNWLNSQVDV